jgi:hypothetical protein
VIKEELIEFAKQYYDDISHPLAVANQFSEMSDEWIVGLFHDILEDNLDSRDIIQNKLLKMFNYNWDIFRAIQYISRDEDVSYFDYIWFIKYMKDENKQGGELAWKVKIADLKHNLSRTETLKPSLKKRYEKALRILLDGENDEIETKTQSQ